MDAVLAYLRYRTSWTWWLIGQLDLIDDIHNQIKMQLIAFGVIEMCHLTAFNNNLQIKNLMTRRYPLLARVYLQQHDALCCRFVDYMIVTPICVWWMDDDVHYYNFNYNKCPFDLNVPFIMNDPACSKHRFFGPVYQYDFVTRQINPTHVIMTVC